MDERNETQDAEEYTAEGGNNPATTSDRVTHRTEIEVQNFDGTYPAAQFFRTYDQKTDWDGLTNTEKVLRLPRYLNNKPLEHFRRLRMETQHYIQVRQTFLDLYPETNEATYAQYFSMKLAGQPNLEEYYRNKTALGLQLGLPQEVILETLTEGLPPSDQRLVRIVPPENLGAWFRLVQRIRGSGAPSPRHPDEHAPPLLGPYAPVRPSPRTVPTRSTPPTDCRFCGGLHWHSECRLRQAPQLPRASGDARAARSAQLAEQRPRAQPHHQASRAQATGITKGAPDQQPTDNQPQPPYPPQFPALLRQYQHVFSRNKFAVPCLKVPPVRIATNSDKVVTIRPYRVPICDQREIRSQIRQMLDNDIIEPSYSPFSSPVTLVTKRDKTKRFCIDYRKVNEVISSDVHPLPRIEDILDRLARAKYFSTADVSSAYWQVPIHPDSRPLLAFATIDGLYQPTRLPFGLKTSPQIYERAINQVLQGHGLDCVAHYFDDFVIYSETLEEHQEHLRRFFAFCDAENLQLNLTKCEFFRQTIEFLGYTITAGTTTPLIRNTDVIHAIPPPNNRKTLQSFLGAVNVYNKFIPDYARLRTPLNNLLKKDVTWDWDDKCQKAFTSLKESLTQHPVLHLYKDELPCQVYCDASTLGIAGVLKQVHSAGKAYPVQYFSRALRVHERNYTISELECLAIVESVEKFRVYLMGRKFTIFSDHHALQWLKTIKNPSGRLFRWSLRLSCYEYEVRYIKGSLQHEADLLSRNPFCGFLDATIIKNHQITPSGESKLTIDRNGLQTLKRRGVTKIVVPDALVPDLLTKVHNRYNHPGISQMTRLISTQYYWKGMSEDISKTTKACAICQSTKPPRGPTFGELGQLPVATQPFDLVALDTIAGLAKYGNAKTYLHVVVDHFSRYTWTFPSKSTSITTYQQVIKRVLQDGSPKRLLTDRAPAFTSPKFRKFLINRNIQPLLTTSNNPQANGLCERLNATLTGKLRLLHLENPKAAWTKLAKRVTVVYNNTPHSVTGFPPGYLMFGVLPPELTEHVNPYPVLTTARRIAHERTQAKHLKDKHAYDQQHKTPHFEPGDLVLVKVYHHPNTGKLAPYFMGPYEILEIISPNVVRINRPNQPLNRNTDTVHVNKLQYYNENIRYIAPPTLIPHPAKPQSRTLPPLFEHLTPDLFTVFWIVFDFYLLKKMDQRTCIKFCVKNEIKCADAFRMLTVAYGEATLDRSNVYRWYKMFSEGREDLNDEERAGRPSTSTTDEKINEVEKMILANRRITVREVAEDLNISIGSCHSIFIDDLGMRRVAAKFVPKLLNCDQKQHRMNIANEMLDSVRDDPNLLQRVIIGDEAWVYGYDVETKAQSSQWKLPHEPRPKKARQVRSNVNVLLTVFFDCRGVVHHEFLPQGRTVNKEYYLQVMRNLRKAIRQKRPDLWKNKNWLLHHDNAPAHTSLLVRDLLAKNNTLMMPQPPYSPYLAPCDFFLFPKLKRPMKGRRYATLDEIKTASVKNGVIKKARGGKEKF
ncbi:hypothetical protein LAZ67_8002859 [Cordylochernes scorpioides]|uniref:RNA-directed DNA polymerase n=1 Tax=Cordylochernes scorpioides TaxID=51811 RepID=A0ABY6KR99_9ARAC|nr:hypothetical protein LAZ67_8002859 [Cordylochernes scorpioides]